MTIEEAYKAMENGKRISRHPLKKHVWWYLNELGYLTMHSGDREIIDGVIVTDAMMRNRDKNDWEVL